MAIGSDYLLKVKLEADAKQLEAKLRSVERQLGDIGGGRGIQNLQKGFAGAASQASNLTAIFTGDRLTGATSQLTAMGGAVSALPGPLGLAIGAAAGLTAGAAALGASIFAATKEAAEFGSRLFDASTKTGLTADAVSALDIASRSAGSSLEDMSGSVAKLNVLVGQAQNGNAKAEATLKQYGITATDANEAFAQAVQVIGQMTDQNQKAAAAQALFKDRTGATLPVIEQMNGNVKEYIEEQKRLGTLLSGDALKAADQFGDQLEILDRQMTVVKFTVAAGLMPVFNDFFTSMSSWLARNQSEIRSWAAGVSFAIRRIITDLRTAVALFKAAVAYGTGDAITGNILATEAYNIFTGNEPLAATAGGGKDASGGNYPISPTGKGGRGGKGGKDNAAREAEERRRKAVQEAEKEMKQKLELYRANAQAAQKIFEKQLSENKISEFEYLKETRALKEREAQYEAVLLANLQRNKNLNAEESADVEHRIKLATNKVQIEQLETEIAINKEYNEANQELGKQIEYQLEAVRLEKERVRLLKQQQQQRDFEFRKQQREARERMDPFGVGHRKKGRGDGADWEVGGVGGLLTGLGQGLGLLQEQVPVMQQLGSMLAETFQGVASAVGEAVHSFVLLGDTGTSFRKFAAEVIASIAQMAVVQAIFELAQGLAMLALFHFTHNPKYMQSATTHFQSAAVFGAIGAVATGVGRATAGGAFRQESGGAGGGGGGGGQTEPEPFTRTTPGAFTSGNPNSPVRRLAEAIEEFGARIVATPPGYVFQAGMRQNPGLVGQQVATDIGRNSGLGRNIARNMGIS